MPRGWRLEASDLEALALGAAILGTGGGGNPYLGMLRARELLRKGHEIRVLPFEELRDDDVVVSVGGIGAPVVGIEKIEKGDECFRALRALEDFTGTRATALVAAEVGGSNSIEPLIAAAYAGLPVLDADGMGRAFPEVQMTSFFIYGARPYPAALADEKGNAVVLAEVKDMYWLERFARSVAIDMGAAAGFALPPMRGEFLKFGAIPHTLTQALELGQEVQRARVLREDPVARVLEVAGGVRLFVGKVVDVARRIEGGFARGHIRLAGLDADRGSTMEIEVQNENLIARRDGEVVATVPDLIALLDLETAEPITTEAVRYGFRVAVVGLPAHPRLKTKEALAVVGPAAFGYDVAYRPLLREV